MILKKKRGFTLVELIVVIAILAILASILIPTIGNYTYKARIESAKTHIASIYKACRLIIPELDVEDKDNFNQALVDKINEDYGYNVEMIEPNMGMRGRLYFVSYFVDEELLIITYWEIKKPADVRDGALITHENGVFV